MAEPNLYAITGAMITYGGSFVKQLGTLIRLADPVNEQRLLAAFPEYVQKYTERAAQKSECDALDASP